MALKKKLNKLAEKFLQMIKEEIAFGEMIASTRYYGISRTNYYRTLRQLEDKKLIKKARRNYKNYYVLTDKGRQLLRSRTQAAKRTDGYSTVIIFDIPEDQARQRTIFRRYLIKNGYMQLQRSVMISPLQITEELKDLARELKINQHINILSAKIHHFV